MWLQCATVIMLAKAVWNYNIWNIANLSFELLKKFNTCSVAMLLVAPIKDSNCLIYMPYSVLVFVRLDTYNILV